METHPLRCREQEVLALKAGRVSQIRRIVIPPPDTAKEVGKHSYENARDLFWDCVVSEKGQGVWRWLETPAPEDRDPFRVDLTCPFGVPGHRIWVKESWSLDSSGNIIYQADKPEGDFVWRPPDMMTEPFARLWFEVLSVRVERVRFITRADLAAEGWGGLDAFLDSWQQWNENRGFGWTRNPYCWIVGVQPIERSANG